MSSRPWMPLYVGDYRMDTLDLTTEQHGAYMILLMLSWLRDDGLPDDMDYLKRSLRCFAPDMHGNRFNRLIPPLLRRYFKLDTDGRWRQDRVEKEREKSRKFSEYAREKANKRWRGSNKVNGLTNTTAMHAGARQSQSHKKLSSFGPSQQEVGEEEPELSRLIKAKGWK